MRERDERRRRRVKRDVVGDPADDLRVAAVRGEVVERRATALGSIGRMAGVAAVGDVQLAATDDPLIDRARRLAFEHVGGRDDGGARR